MGDLPYLKVVKIPSASPSPELVSVIESVVEAINEGNVVGVVGVVLYRDGGTNQFRAGEQTLSLVGRLEAVKAKILNEFSL